MKDSKKCLLAFLIFAVLLVLFVILYFHYGDSYMNRCFLVKIAGVFILVAVVILFIALLFCSAPKDYPKTYHHCDCCKKYILIQKAKESYQEYYSHDFENLLPKLQVNNIIKINDESFVFDSTVLAQKKIKLKYNQNENTYTVISIDK